MTTTGQLADHALSFDVESDWARLPPGVKLGDVAAVAVDDKDRLYAFTRGEHPLIVFDEEGNVLRTFGHGIFRRPHGLSIDRDGMLWCTDDADHVVRKFSPKGALLLQIGTPGVPQPRMSGLPFHRCTHTAVGPNGDIYVSDGYGNACIHRYDPVGRHMQSWGHSGSGDGEFYVPHNLVCDDDGHIYVADRENHRIQIFNGNGDYMAQWHDLHRPCALCLAHDHFYIGEVGPAMTATLDFPNLGPRITILDKKGQRVARLSAGGAGIGGGRFIAPHGIAVNSRGDIFVAEVAQQAWPAVFPEKDWPPGVPTLTKLTRRASAQAPAVSGACLMPDNGPSPPIRA